MRKNLTTLLLLPALLFVVACGENQVKQEKDDFFVFDFGTEARMVQQGFLEEKTKGMSNDQDLGGHIISNADDRLEMKTEYSGGSYALNELIREGVSEINLRGQTEKEIFVASSYYDHSAQKQIVLFARSIGSGEIDYTISIKDILALRKEGISSR
jgi:hypothetical protein